MVECFHGLEEEWCALCNNTRLQAASKAPEGQQCVVRGCDRWATTQLGRADLCSRDAALADAAVNRTSRTRLWRQFKFEDQKAVDKQRREWVYFLRLGADAVKIGYSRDVVARFRSITTYTFGELVALEAGSRALEKRLHRRFADHTIRGVTGTKEMFSLAPEILEYIEGERACAVLECEEKAVPNDVACAEHEGMFEIIALLGATAGPPNNEWQPGQLAHQN